MTDDRTAQMQHIAALLDERRKIETWIAALDARRSGTPTHVMLRVEQDYRAKLADAHARLSQEMGAVRTIAAQLEQDLVEHDAGVEHKRDERAEGELRAAVGEHTPKEWDKLRAKCDAALEQLEAARDVVRHELETLQALLSEAATGVEATVSAAAATEGAVIDGRAPVSRNAESGGETKEAKAPSTEAASAFASVPTVVTPPARDPVPEPRPFGMVPTTPTDELAFLRDVLGASTPPASPASPVAPVAPVAPRTSASDPSRPATSPSGQRAQPATPAASDRVPEMFGGAPAHFRMTEDQARESGAFDKLSNTFGMKTPSAAEVVKSLKCNECGSMNHPTEWYCEKCGGELAAF